MLLRIVLSASDWFCAIVTRLSKNCGGFYEMAGCQLVVLTSTIPLRLDRVIRLPNPNYAAISKDEKMVLAEHLLRRLELSNNKKPDKQSFSYRDTRNSSLI